MGEDGIVVSSLHVVENADSLEVSLESGEVYDSVYYIGRDDRRDLVILQIPAISLPTIPIGDDRVAQVGDPVYVLGSPLGFEGTLSSGLLSAKRTEDGVSYLQVSAPISQGSSGGPVINEFGQAIGVVTSTVEDAQNLNLAVPARYASGMLLVASDAVPFSDIADELRTNFTEPNEERIDTNAVFSTLPVDVQEEISNLDLWDQQVILRVTAVEALFLEQGWEGFEDNSEFGYLQQDETSLVHFDLRAGEYTAVGVCDDDCTDLDLYVYDEDGQLVGEDFEIDPIAIVSFFVNGRETYSFDFDMISCSTDFCAYGVVVLVRGE